MKKVVICACLIFFLNSCVQTPQTITVDSLYDQYDRYISLLDDELYIDAIDLLSERNQSDLKTNSNRSGFLDYFPVVSSINKIFEKEISNFEETDKIKGCLTVNGYDFFKEPTSINIKYNNENGLWKLDYVQIIYHDSKDQLTDKFTCPTKF